MCFFSISQFFVLYLRWFSHLPRKKMHTSAYIIFFKETTEGSQDDYPGPENI